MNIGMIVAIPEEIGALFRSCGTPAGTEKFPGYTVYHYDIRGHAVHVVGSGVGEIAAAAAAQFLITRFGAELLVNFGVCGGLTEEMGLRRTVVVGKAVHYDFDTSAYDKAEPGRYLAYPDVYIPAAPELVRLACAAEPALQPVICASADKFVADPAAKTALYARFGAEICEMEAAGILLTANRCGVPALLVKGVSDSVRGGGEEFAAMVHESAALCVRVLLKILTTLPAV